MSDYCRFCGSRLCNHGNCPECNPCRHCDGGGREDKFEEDYDGWLEEQEKDM